MIRKISADQRHLSSSDWLKSYRLFSFADYFDPNNVRFGTLRVFNDDVVQPGTGFPTHEHKEMEIVTIGIEGEVTHRDSLGNKSLIGAGEVQLMSAGMGLSHSETNESRHPVHFYQLWVEPNVHALKPSYEQRHFKPESRRNTLLPVASGKEQGDAMRLHADAVVYVGAFDAGTTADFDASAVRGIFIYVTKGRMHVGGEQFGPGDQARITPEGPFSLHFEERTELVVVDIVRDNSMTYD
jgi:hypothetical protein